MENIPTGHTKEDIKTREKIIKDFYAKWISENPEKKVYNVHLKQYILVKFLSINETYEKASRNYESTLAVMQLNDILANAAPLPSSEKATKKNTKNQKQFEKLLILKYKDIKLTVGLQRSNHDLVQYCISVPQKNKAD